MRRRDIVAGAGMLLPTGIVIGLYVYIGGFNRMLGDDYCSMYYGKRLDFLRFIWYWYKSWHGGFSASAVDWLISFLGPGAFPFHTFVFLSAWLVFAILAIKKALEFRGYLSLRLFAAFLLAFFFVFTTLRLSPHIPQSVFWWGGARGYLSPLILSTLYFVLYYRFIISALPRVRTIVWLLISFGLAFFTGGFSETFTPVFVVLLAGLAAIRWLAARFNLKDAAALFLSAGFLGALLSLLTMVLAPGNSIRQTYFPAPPGVFTISSVAFAGYLAFLYTILSSPYMLMGLLGALLGSIWLGMRMNGESAIAAPPVWQAPAFLSAGFVLAFGAFPPAVYGTSEPPPERALIIPAFFLTACFLASGFVFGEWLMARGKMGQWSSAVLALACSLVIFSSYGTFQNLYSTRNEHAAFARQWDQVDARIRGAKEAGLAEIRIPLMENWAGVEYPTDNPRYWPNACYSKFYDINITASP